MSIPGDTSNPSETGLELTAQTEPSSPASESFAKDLRGFGPVGILAILAIIFSGNVFLGKIVLPVGAILVLVWRKWSLTTWREIGYVKPKDWIIMVATGIFLGIAFKLLMKAIVMPLLNADPVNQTYHYLAGNAAMLPFAIWAMLAAGFGEETVFRGWMFERIGKLFGNKSWAKPLTVLITAVLFGLAHYANQGIPGVEQATIFGIVFGTIYAATGRLFMLMVAHAAFDLTALAIIYWDLESWVAYLVFPN